jgi:hypothetical protein
LLVKGEIDDVVWISLCAEGTSCIAHYFERFYAGREDIKRENAKVSMDDDPSANVLDILTTLKLPHGRYRYKITVKHNQDYRTTK